MSSTIYTGLLHNGKEVFARYSYSGFTTSHNKPSSNIAKQCINDGSACTFDHATYYVCQSDDVQYYLCPLCLQKTYSREPKLCEWVMQMESHITREYEKPLLVA